MPFVGKADAPDVPPFARGVVDPAEHEAVLDGAQLRQTVLVHRGEGVTLGALRGRTVRPSGTHVAQPLPCLRTQRVKARVCAVRHGLLFLQLC